MRTKVLYIPTGEFLSFQKKRTNPENPMKYTLIWEESAAYYKNNNKISLRSYLLGHNRGRTSLFLERNNIVTPFDISEFDILHERG
jgi:sensor domain CHASE-containing protein